MPEFSIVVPIYRVEKYLRVCVDSILNQSFRDFELILVDDGSPDSCPDICDEYARADSRVSVIHQSNAGVACARNAGVRFASGEYLIFLDGDDYLKDATVIEKIARKTTLMPDVILLGYQKYFESTGAYGPAVVPVIDGILDTAATLKTLLQTDTYDGTAWTKVVKSKLIKDSAIEFRPGMISEDVDWYLNLLCRAERFAGLNDVAVVYRQHQGSVSHSTKEKALADNLWILEFWPEHVGQSVKETAVRDAMKGIFAFYYANDLILYAGYPGPVSRPYRDRMKKQDGWLDFAVTARARRIRSFYRLFGFEWTVAALRLALRMKTRA